RPRRPPCTIKGATTVVRLPFRSRLGGRCRCRSLLRDGHVHVLTILPGLGDPRLLLGRVVAKALLPAVGLTRLTRHGSLLSLVSRARERATSGRDRYSRRSGRPPA